MLVIGFGLGTWVAKTAFYGTPITTKDNLVVGEKYMVAATFKLPDDYSNIYLFLLDKKNDMRIYKFSITDLPPAVSDGSIIVKFTDDKLALVRN